MNNLVGSGSLAAGLFYSRDNSDTAHRPALAITYQGAAIQWAGYTSATWDTSAVNWNVGGYRGAFGNGDFVTFSEGTAIRAFPSPAAGFRPAQRRSIIVPPPTVSPAAASAGAAVRRNKAPGQATLSASNNYSGPTLTQGGKLIVAANNALGTTGSGTVVSNGAALGFQGVNYPSAEPLTISGAGVSSSGALYAVSGNNTFGGPVTLAADSTIGVASSLGLTLNNAISGGFGIAKNGGGWLTLARRRQYLQRRHAGQPGTAGVKRLGNPSHSPVIDVAAGATFDVAAVTGGFILGAAGDQTLKGSGTVNGNVATTGLARLEPGDSAGTLTFLNNLSLAAGVTNYFELTNSLAIGGGTNDLIVVAGDLTLNNNVIAITVLGRPRWVGALIASSITPASRPAPSTQRPSS